MRTIGLYILIYYINYSMLYVNINCPIFLPALKYKLLKVIKLLKIYFIYLIFALRRIVLEANCPGGELSRWRIVRHLFLFIFMTLTQFIHLYRIISISSASRIVVK